MTPSKSLAAAALALSSISTASAQTAPSIIQCKWQDGITEYYRVSPSVWDQFDKASWVWKPRECKYSFDVSCTVEISVDSYKWTLSGKEFIDGGKVWTNSRVYSVLEINRMTGSLSFSYQLLSESWKTELHTAEQNAMSGSCEKSADPALEPKPALPVPKL